MLKWFGAKYSRGDIGMMAKLWNLYSYDGTHLSDRGNEVYLNNIQGALEYFLSSNSNYRIFPPE